MSWILGYVGRSLSHEQRERLSAVGPDPLVEFAGETFFISAGGLPETCLGGRLPNDSGHWCVVGSGVRLDGGQAAFLAASDWIRFLCFQRPRFDSLGGGFIALRISTARVEAFTDVLGLRSLYWLRVNDGYYFSSRSEWLASLCGGLSIDWPTFGSHWLTYNQLSARSLINGLERLGPHGRVTFADTDFVEESHTYDLPARHSDSEVEELLQMQLHSVDARTVSLGLSGGMDSRTLLALRGRSKKFAVHVFGPTTKADVRVALKIAEEEDLNISHFSEAMPPRDALLEVVRRHAVQTQAVSPASSALSLRYYPQLRSQQKIVVDGAFGEILRRQFMNRLLRRGSHALKKRSVVQALEHIRFKRAPIFSEEVERDMEMGARRDFAACLSELPDSTRHGIETALDVLNVRTRLPNFFGYEQARLDEIVQSFMPFAHPLAVDAALQVPSARRKSGRTARRIISRRAPQLRRYPLVKGGIEYPYGLPTAAAALWVMMKKKVGSAADSADRTFVLVALKEFILDRIHSADVQNHPAYDRIGLTNMAEAYYTRGDGGAQVDWWLAFDLWREAVESP